MPAALTDPARPVPSRPMPSIAPGDLRALSDDECLLRLARAIAAHDPDHLDEVAWLIGRLAVAIE